MADVLFKFEFEEKGSPGGGTPRSGGSAPWDRPNAAGHLGAKWADPRQHRPMPRPTPGQAAEAVARNNPRPPATRPPGTPRVPTPPPRGLAAAGSAIQTAVQARLAGGLGNVAGMGGAASRALAALGPAGLAIGAVGLAFGILVKTVSMLNNKFKEMTRELAPYSGAISMAQIKNEIAQTMQDLRRAKTMGPQLAKFETEGGRIDRAIQRGTDKILEPILEVFTPIMEGIADGVEALAEHGDEIKIATKALLAIAAPGAVAMAEIQKLTKEANKQRELAQLDDVRKRFHALKNIEDQVLEGKRLDPLDLELPNMGAPQ